MRNRNVFTHFVTIVLVTFGAMTWLSYQPTAHSATLGPAQGAIASGGAVTSSTSTSTGSSTFVPMPGMSITTPFIFVGDLLINFAAETACSTALTTFQVRCLVDGVVIQPAELTFDRGTGSEAHAMNFLAPNVGLGTHQIRIDWRQSGLAGTITVDERCLSYSNVN